MKVCLQYVYGFAEVQGACSDCSILYHLSNISKEIFSTPDKCKKENSGVEEYHMEQHIRSSLGWRLSPPPVSWGASLFQLCISHSKQFWIWWITWLSVPIAERLWYLCLAPKCSLIQIPQPSAGWRRHRFTVSSHSCHLVDKWFQASSSPKNLLEQGEVNTLWSVLHSRNLVCYG